MIKSSITIGLLATFSVTIYGCSSSVSQVPQPVQPETSRATTQPIKTQDSSSPTESIPPTEVETAQVKKSEVARVSNSPQPSRSKLPSIAESKLNRQTMLKDCQDVDLANWEHPTKKVMIERGVEIVGVQLCDNQTFPVFFVNFKYDPQGQTKDYFFPLYAAMSKANGDHSFAFVSLRDDKIISVGFERSTGEIITNFYDLP
jgi:hypothetical protein